MYLQNIPINASDFAYQFLKQYRSDTWMGRYAEVDTLLVEIDKQNQRLHLYISFIEISQLQRLR